MTGYINGIVEAFEQGRLTRREMVARIAGLAVAGGSAAALAQEKKDKPPTFEAKGLNHLALQVTDVARSRDWYAKHLGLSVIRENSPYNCFMGCGEHFVALFRGTPAGMHHYAYTIDNYDPARAVKTLESAGLSPRREQNRVYFPDPDGLTVQVSPRGQVRFGQE